VKRPVLSGDLGLLIGWSELHDAAGPATGAPDRAGVQQVLDGTVTDLVDVFAAVVGLWPDSS
jgi:hypothetical protein